jgi:iron complex transport system permease protein
MDVGLIRVGFAFVGALLSLMLVMAIAKRQGSLNVQTLLLSGVVVGALLSGLTTLNLSLAGQDTGKILWWLLGSTYPMFWDRVAILAVVLLVGGLVLHRQSRPLNAFSVSEFMAERQGVETGKLKWIVLVTCAAMTGVAVGTVGIVGFVGLVAPHIARRVAGNDLRGVMPTSAFFGSTLLLGADLLAQRIRPGWELPLGAVTAVLGAPALLWLLKQKG